MIRYLLEQRKGRVVATLVVVAVLASFAVLGFVLPDRGSTSADHSAAHSGNATASIPVPAGSPGSNVLSATELARLDAAPDVPPTTSRLLAPIIAADRTHPDLYARAFFTGLFVHPYLGVSRGEMLAWLQTQQATTAFITGGSPDQRNRLLIVSASDPSWSNHGFAAVPDPSTWEQASAGAMSVRIDRLVCVTPPDWEQALAEGAISDPGLTERVVSGDMTVTLIQNGRTITEKISVALTLLLEGPPSATQYGVVVIADTNAVKGHS